MLLLLAQGCIHLSAQQDLGVRNSNYAGIQGALLNPSSIANSSLKWDLNICSVAEIFDNNFLFAPKKSLSFFGIKKIIDGSIHENSSIFRNRIFGTPHCMIIHHASTVWDGCNTDCITQQYCTAQAITNFVQV